MHLFISELDKYSTSVCAAAAYRLIEFEDVVSFYEQGNVPVGKLVKLINNKIIKLPAYMTLESFLSNLAKDTNGRLFVYVSNFLNRNDYIRGTQQFFYSLEEGINECLLRILRDVTANLSRDFTRFIYDFNEYEDDRPITDAVFSRLIYYANNELPSNVLNQAIDIINSNKKIITSYINKTLVSNGLGFWGDTTNFIFLYSILFAKKFNKLDINFLDKMFTTLRPLSAYLVPPANLILENVRSEASLVKDIISIYKVWNLIHDLGWLEPAKIRNIMQSTTFKNFISIKEVNENPEELNKISLDLGIPLKDAKREVDEIKLKVEESDSNKKLIEVIILVKSHDNLLFKYKDSFEKLSKKNAISKNFVQELNEVVDFFESGRELHPRAPYFREMIKKIESVSSDLNLIIQYQVFEQYYDEALKNPKVPELFKLNLQINEQVRFRVLKDLDPQYLRIGIETKCCQRQGGAGELAMVDSFVNPQAGVLILEQLVDSFWKPVAQSYFHYVPPGQLKGKPGVFTYKKASDDFSKGGYILDNIEKIADELYGIPIEEYYAYWALTKKQELGVGYIQSGAGYSEDIAKKFGKLKMEEDPRNFHTQNYYTDWSANNIIDLTNPKFEFNHFPDPKRPEKLAVANVLKLARVFSISSS